MKTILLVDNDPSFLETRAEFLTEAGYEVLTACTIQEAHSLLASRRVHLAVVDIRMVNDQDERDVSGLILAKEKDYLPVPKIIVTRFPTFEAVREALGPALEGLPPAVGFVAKQEGPEKLLEALGIALAQNVSINWDLRIVFGERQRSSFPHLVALIDPVADMAYLSDRASELEDLIRKLFHSRAQVTFGRLLWHRDARACLAAYAYHSGGAREQYLVTCGARAQIEDEVAHHKTLTSDGAHRSVLASSADTMRFGAVAYALHGADLEHVQPFREFYQLNRVAQNRAALDHLFLVTLAQWHQRRHLPEPSRSLREVFAERLGMTAEAKSWKDIEARARALALGAITLGPTQMELSASALSLHFANGQTVSWSNPFAVAFEEPVKVGISLVCVPSPGTLNSDNILVGPDGQTWVSDFGQAGSVPLLWDFICCEAMVRFDLLESTDLQALHHFETRLTSTTLLSERLDTLDIDAPFRKALSVIQHIRRLAQGEAGSDPAPYRLGLCLWALSKVGEYDPGITHSPRQLSRFAHALLTAAMINDRIQELAKKPSPEESPRPIKGIEIDEPNRQVWVEGRRVELSPLEFDSLLFLYQHAGQLCTRHSIVVEGLKDTFMGDDQEASRINTLVRRLRKKIEPDPDHPRYIRTIRGQGYMLDLGGEQNQ